MHFLYNIIHIVKKYSITSVNNQLPVSKGWITNKNTILLKAACAEPPNTKLSASKMLVNGSTASRVIPYNGKQRVTDSMIDTIFKILFKLPSA
jgi:hypothetical protein